jgi:hypothetical protein
MTNDRFLQCRPKQPLLSTRQVLQTSKRALVYLSYIEDSRYEGAADRFSVTVIYYFDVISIYRRVL